MWAGRGGEDLLAALCVSPQCCTGQLWWEGASSGWGQVLPNVDLAGYGLNQAPRSSLGRVQGGVNAALLQFQSLRLQFCMSSS